MSGRQKWSFDSPGSNYRQLYGWYSWFLMLSLSEFLFSVRHWLLLSKALRWLTIHLALSFNNDSFFFHTSINLWLFMLDFLLLSVASLLLKSPFRQRNQFWYFNKDFKIFHLQFLCQSLCFLFYIEVSILHPVLPCCLYLACLDYLSYFSCLTNLPIATSAVLRLCDTFVTTALLTLGL